MKKINGLLAALVMLASAGTAFAADDMYGEVGYLAFKFKDSDGGSVKPKDLRFVVGKELNSNLAAELIGAINVKKDEDYSANTFGVYLKPKATVVQDLDVFARVGVARTTLKYPNGYSGHVTKAAYGVGAQYQLTKDVYGQVDYMHYGKDNGVTARGFTISVGTRF